MYRDNFIYPETKIPEEGLLLYPVAVRAPTGHKLSLIDDVKLKASLLSHDRSEHGDFTPNMFSCHEGWLEEHLERGIDSWWFGRDYKDFHILQPLRSLGPPVLEHYEECGYSLGGLHVCLYIPTETLMKDHGGRLTDSGQVVTDQIVPFSKIRGGWIQDGNCRWQRLIVPSGEEQVVRTGSLRSRTAATKESVMRIPQQCVNTSNQPYDEDTMDVMTILARFNNHQIIEGGKEQYEARLKLVDYILERKAVTEAGCRYCPHKRR